jgi:hypothetical protein
MVAPEPSQDGRQVLESWDTWRHAIACLILGLELEHVYRGTRNVGYRQWPPGPPQERPWTHRWGQHLFSHTALLGLVLVFSWSGGAPLSVDTR